ncbi:MAG: Rha family transcriptional regulator [Ruminococcus sp.]|nr:Rha family transcriptional regulator [Ruminococcus sp.]
MKELTPMNFNGVDVIDSRQVAEAVEKKHCNLLRDIAIYCGYLNELNFESVEFFIESTYTDGKGEERPCYFCTRKGCEMIANKLTGKKGVAFTALYINAFHAMEQHIKENKPLQTASDDDEPPRLKIVRKLMEVAQMDGLSKTHECILFDMASEILTGKTILQIESAKKPKTYLAGDIARIFGTTAYQIGCIANVLSMKNKEYGEWYYYTRPTDDERIRAFKYNEKALEKFRQIFETINK